MGILANNTDSDTFGCKQARYDGSPKSACEFGPIQVSRFHFYRVKLAKQPNPRPGEASLRKSMRMPWLRQCRGRGIVPLISYSQKAAHRAVFWTGRALSIDILGSLRSRWALLRRDAYAWYFTYRVVLGFPRWRTAGQDADFLEYVLKRCHAVNPRKAVFLQFLKHFKFIS